jgi:conjugal transfer pilus assembly protein TraA
VTHQQRSNSKVQEEQYLMTDKTTMSQRAAAILVAMLPMIALAGTGGSEFDDIWITLSDWVEGTLGRVIAAGIVVVGIVAGIVRQSLMAFAIGIGGGMGLYNTPTIIEEILTATLPILG